MDTSMTAYDMEAEFSDKNLKINDCPDNKTG